MKNIILAACLTIIPALASAEQTHCEIAGDTARITMKFRQDNAPMSRLMNIAGEQEYLRELVIAAYGLPLFVTDSAKQRSIEEFGNEVERICYKGGY